VDGVDELVEFVRELVGGVLVGVGFVKVGRFRRCIFCETGVIFSEFFGRCVDLGGVCADVVEPRGVDGVDELVEFVPVS
jgi:hypothetical protein